MARPAPSDLDFAPTQAKTFVNPVAVDLTAQFTAATNPPEFGYAATVLKVTSAAGGSLVVRMQADPATNVSILFAAAANCIELRGAFVQLVSTTDAAMSVTAFWQGGPC